VVGLSTSNTRGVPNQNSRIKFLIREGLTAKFPEGRLHPARQEISHNGTDRMGADEVKTFVSASYREIPVTGLVNQQFPVLGLKARKGFRPLFEAASRTISHAKHIQLALLSSRRQNSAPASPATLTPSFVQTAEGSVLVSLGNTRVLTCATIEQGVPGWLRNSGRGW